MDWLNSLFPILPEHNLEDTKVANVKDDKGETKFSVSNWAKYTNSKASLVNAGQKGHIYAGRFKPFATEDIMKMMGVYVLDGLAPSPQLIQKMRPQSVDAVQGNDFIAGCVGGNYEMLYKTFPTFFAVQDPLTTPPPKNECPNFKVDELFWWLCHIFAEAWLLGKNFSVDEQTCRIQGKSKYKTRCVKFKRIDDAIQTGCIADDAYTYAFYFRNEPSGEKYIRMGMCPLYSRLLYMWEHLPDSGHHCNMDNLYASVSLARAGYSPPRPAGPVLIHGVIRKSGRGVLPSVIQDDLTGKKAAEMAMGTVKLAVLRDDSQSSELIVASCYDQKPFYMLSHSIEEVTWVTCVSKESVQPFTAEGDFL